MASVVSTHALGVVGRIYSTPCFEDGYHAVDRCIRLVRIDVGACAIHCKSHRRAVERRRLGACGFVDQPGQRPRTPASGAVEGAGNHCMVGSEWRRRGIRVQSWGSRAALLQPRGDVGDSVMPRSPPKLGLRRLPVLAPHLGPGASSTLRSASSKSRRDTGRRSSLSYSSRFIWPSILPACSASATRSKRRCCSSPGCRGSRAVSCW